MRQGQKRDPVRTPIPLDEMLVALYTVWLYRLRGSPPPLHAVNILAAQWAFETGWGRACWNWGLANAKTVAGGSLDWCFRRCGEELMASTAKREAARDERIVILNEYVKGGRAMASIAVLPEHPWCCFRAFDTLTEGVTDWLLLLHRRFGSAFTASIHGDAEAFCTELKRLRFFTADVGQYTKGLIGCLPRIERASAVINWDQCPRLTDWQIEQVEGITEISASLGDDDWDAMRAERDAAVQGDDEPDGAA